MLCPTAARHWTLPGLSHLPCFRSIRVILEGSLVLDSPIKAVHQGPVGRFASASTRINTASGLRHWCPEDSIPCTPWLEVTSILLLFQVPLVSFLVGIRTAGLSFVWRTNLVSHPTSWCWCKNVDKERHKDVKIQIMMFSDGILVLHFLQSLNLTLTARFTWLSWVTGAASKGRLEVMDGLLKYLPFSALMTVNKSD